MVCWECLCWQSSPLTTLPLSITVQDYKPQGGVSGWLNEGTDWYSGYQEAGRGGVCPSNFLHTWGGPWDGHILDSQQINIYAHSSRSLGAEPPPRHGSAKGVLSSLSTLRLSKMVRSLKLQILHFQIFHQNILNTHSGPEMVLSIADTVVVPQSSLYLHRAEATIQEFQPLVP